MLPLPACQRGEAIEWQLKLQWGADPPSRAQHSELDTGSSRAGGVWPQNYCLLPGTTCEFIRLVQKCQGVRATVPAQDQVPLMWQSPLQAARLLDRSHQVGNTCLCLTCLLLPSHRRGERIMSAWEHFCTPSLPHCGSLFSLLLLLQILFLQRTETPTTALPLSRFAWHSVVFCCFCTGFEWFNRHMQEARTVLGRESLWLLISGQENPDPAHW